MLFCKHADIFYGSSGFFYIADTIFCSAVSSRIFYISFFGIWHSIDKHFHDHIFCFSYLDTGNYRLWFQKALINSFVFTDRVNGTAIGCDNVFYTRIFFDHIWYCLI